MKMFAAICLLASMLQAKSIEQFIAMYKAKEYAQVCNEGLKYYYGGRDNEHFVALVGSACAHIDNINPLGLLQRHLISNANMRETASYFSTLIVQKRLLIQFMADGSSIEALTLPYSGHILSFVFEHIASKNYTLIKEEPKMIKIEEGSRSVILFLTDSKPLKLNIDEFESSKLKQRHWFQ